MFFLSLTEVLIDVMLLYDGAPTPPGTFLGWVDVNPHAPLADLSVVGGSHWVPLPPLSPLIARYRVSETWFSLLLCLYFSAAAGLVWK